MNSKTSVASSIKDANSQIPIKAILIDSNNLEIKEVLVNDCIIDIESLFPTTKSEQFKRLGTDEDSVLIVDSQPGGNYGFKMGKFQIYGNAVVVGITVDGFKDVTVTADSLKPYVTFFQD